MEVILRHICGVGREPFIILFGDELGHPVSGTAVTLNGCMPSLRLSSHNRRGGVMEVFLVPPSIVL